MAGTPDPVTPECLSGKVVIGYEGEPLSDKDWYGLYDQEPNPEDWRIGLVGYESGKDASGEWQWAEKGNRYFTKQDHGDALRTVYWTSNGGPTRYSPVGDTAPAHLYCKL